MQPGPGGMPNIQDILQQAQAMQEKLASAQQELEDVEVTGTAGGGMVTATVSGAGELVALTIDPKVIDPEDGETLADLVIAAVRDANSNAQKLAEEKMGGLAGGFGGALGLPGF
ncbi:DNA-binding YbaB/EbfC family protein [Kibdelosporangium phytohabitans]|nr:DNA-binding YbaB/EbfC family protein [Kibdelosporangium phytohabitans]